MDLAPKLHLNLTLGLKKKEHYAFDLYSFLYFFSKTGRWI